MTQLSMIDNGNQVTVAEYTYDALGRRIRALESTGGTLAGQDFYYDGQRVVAEFSASAATLARYYIDGGAGDAGAIDEHVLVHTAKGNADFVYVSRELNTVGALLNASGGLQESYDYDAYGLVRMYNSAGNPITQSGTGQKYFFTGQRLDRYDSTLADPRPNLYHYRARAYWPVHGRFLQRDPLDYVDAINLYEYVLSRPAVFPDPTGEEIDGPIQVGNTYWYHVYRDPVNWLGLIFGEELPESGTYVGSVAWSAASYNVNERDSLELEARRIAEKIEDGAQIEGLAASLQASAIAASIAVRVIATTADDVASAIEFVHDPSVCNAVAVLPFVPGTLKKLDDLADVAKLTGQIHHAISKNIWAALERHPLLRGSYSYRDARFVTQAKNIQSHIGYQAWHRELDIEVEKWLELHDFATPKEFEHFLKDRYDKSDLKELFPNGLP